jgi:hypothetical protein
MQAHVRSCQSIPRCGVFCYYNIKQQQWEALRVGATAHRNTQQQHWTDTTSDGMSARRSACAVPLVPPEHDDHKVDQAPYNEQAADQQQH